MPIPYLLLGVLIKENELGSIPKCCVGVIKDDSESIRESHQEKPNLDNPIYRCGWCGNIVDYDGIQLSDEMFRYSANILNNYPHTDLRIKELTGYCCKDRRD